MEETQPRTGSPISPIARVFFFLAGVVALIVGGLITLGVALAGVLAMGVTALLLRRKHRRITRRGAWLASVGGTVSVMAIVVGFAMISNQPQKPMTAAERAEQRARATQSMPEWMKAVNPNAQRQSQAADSMATALLENKAVMVWAGLMGAVIASSLIGTIAGSFAWGGVMLLNRAFTGDWLPSTDGSPSGL